MTCELHRTCIDKFRDALRGCKFGFRGQSSFFGHLFAAALVVAVAWIAKADRVEWCILLICITIVMTAEMLNTALEYMAKAITREHHPEIGRALDTGSGAVLIAAIGAAIVGLIVLLPRVADLCGWRF